MTKLFALGLIIGVLLPLSAWGQVALEVQLPQPGEEFIGSWANNEWCSVSFANRGPFPCAYPVITYPPSPSVECMCEAQKLHQAEVDQARQREKPERGSEIDITNRAIEERYQQQPERGSEIDIEKKAIEERYREKGAPL
jgi:hypothetical protein